MLGKTDSTAAAAVIAASTPLAGEYAIIVLAALLGALVSLSKMEPHPEAMRRRWDGAKFLFRSTAVSCAFTWLAASIAAKMTGQDMYQLLFPVAFAIGWVGDGWIGVRDKLVNKLAKRADPEG